MQHLGQLDSVLRELEKLQSPGNSHAGTLPQELLRRLAELGVTARPTEPLSGLVDLVWRRAGEVAIAARAS